MNSNSELFTAFMVKAHETNWSTADQPASLWTRTQSDRNWTIVVKEADPYRLIPVAVAMTPEESEAEAMLLMYGWVTAVDEDTLEPVDDDTKKRIRVMLHMNKGKEMVAVQIHGDTLQQFPDIGEGYFTEVVSSLRSVQRELEAHKRSDVSAIAEMMTRKMFEAIFEDDNGGES